MPRHWAPHHQDPAQPRVLEEALVPVGALGSAAPELVLRGSWSSLSPHTQFLLLIRGVLCFTLAL